MVVTASRRQVARALVAALRQHPERRQKLLRSVAALMIERKQVRQLDLLVKDIARELQTQESQLFAEVQSAFALDAGTRRELETALRRQTGAASVEFDEQVRPELLSGIVARTPEYQLDLSARRKLNQLASLSRS